MVGAAAVGVGVCSLGSDLVVAKLHLIGCVAVGPGPSASWFYVASAKHGSHRICYVNAGFFAPR